MPGSRISRSAPDPGGAKVREPLIEEAGHPVEDLAAGTGNAGGRTQALHRMHHDQLRG